MGINTHISKGPKEYVMRLNKEDAKTLARIIEPWTIESMKYKIMYLI